MIPLLTLWAITPPGGTTLRLTSSPPVRPEQVPFPQRGVWIDGTPWYCVGVNIQGEERAVGRVPTVRMTVALTEYVRGRQDSTFVSSAVVTRYQTDARAADAANWADGVNPWASTPSQVNHRVDRWVVTRVTQEEGEVLALEMQPENAFWQQVVRPDVRGRCYHTYRGAACGYGGTAYFDAEGNTVSALADDVCGLRIKDCELRFPTGALPYGGLPS